MTQASHPFCYSELHTEDPTRARQFYTALFSWPVTVHPLPAGEYTELQPGGPIPGGLLRGMFEGGRSQWVPYVAVDDLERFTARAKELGARGVHELGTVPEQGRFSLLVDPAGAPFGIWQPLAK
jgi:predicted enzyme related to lactoylglutathione lyase